MKLGRHLPTSPSPLQALDLAQRLLCDTIQIFVNNPMSWQPPRETRRAPGKADPAAFARAAAERGIAPVVVHAPYLVNLASPDATIFDRSGILLTQTIQRASTFGAGYVVVHMGSHRGAGLQAGLTRLGDGLRRVLAETPDTITVLLENDAGAGDEVGSRVEHLARTLDALPEYPARLGICLDTAHLWGAGYDLSAAAAVTRMLADVERQIGLHRLPVIHLNDTTAARGSHRDHHARIGEGIIPAAALGALLRYPALQEAAIILETPVPTLEGDQRRQDWAREAAHLARARALLQADTGEELHQPA